jgi:S-DNA-T family DNA segregation ATPase FtsK/SpoIIIE
MFENRDLRQDLLALTLLAATIFLTVSLVTYDPADPIGELPRPFQRLYQQDIVVYPLHDTITNACGWWGALAADITFTLLGVGAYLLVISLGAVDLLLLRRRKLDLLAVRFGGWLLSMLGLTTLLTLLVPHLTPGPVIGSGGYLGVIGSGLLEAHFALAGSLIMALSVMVGGVLLSTDYAALKLGWSVMTVTARPLASVTRRSYQHLAHWPAHLRRLRTDPAASADSSSSGTALPVQATELEVKVRGKTLSPAPVLPASPTPTDLPSTSAAQVLNEQPEEREDEPQLADPTESESVESDEADVVVKKQEKNKSKRMAKKPHFIAKKFEQEDRDEVMSKLDEATHEQAGEYELPDVSLLIEGDDFCYDEQVKEVRRKAKMIEKTFADFGFNVKVVEIDTGPVIAQYEVELEAGLRLSKITGLADDLAIALRVPSVRIVAPIPGKNTVGIEVPNEVRQVVRLREVIEETNGKTQKMKIPLFLGKDVSGSPLTVDLATLPHLLIAGRTGTGKSVCLNAIISSILMTKKPDEVRLLMIDPKMVELSGYGRLPHLMHPVVTDMRKAEAILAWAVEKMEERYALLARASVRHITSYNQLNEDELRRRIQPEDEDQWAGIPRHLPFIVIVADEMADLMMTSGKEVEQHIIRLAQKSRAVGIHLILATQKPTVDVITGLIKSNLPARISFQVASRTDSRVVLDEMGADKLLGNGDMLFLWPGTSTLLRGQGTYLTDEEIERIVEFVSQGEQHFVHELVNLKVEQPNNQEGPGPLKNRDELYEAAVDIVVREGRGSCSLLQRALGIGYGRAARLIDYMAEDGIVGPYNGSQARDVQISIADWEQMQAGGSAVDPDGTRPANPPSSASMVHRPASSGVMATSTTGAPTGGSSNSTSAGAPAASTHPASVPATAARRRSNKIAPSPSWDDTDDDEDESADRATAGQARNAQHRLEKQGGNPADDDAFDDPDAFEDLDQDESFEDFAADEDDVRDDTFEDENFAEEDIEEEAVDRIGRDRGVHDRRSPKRTSRSRRSDDDSEQDDGLSEEPQQRPGGTDKKQSRTGSSRRVRRA